MARSKISSRKPTIYRSYDGLETQTIDLSGSEFKRSFFLLVGENGTLYEITIWAGSAILSQISSSSLLNVSLSNKILTISPLTAGTDLKFVLLYLG